MAGVSFLLGGPLLSLRCPPIPRHVCLLPSLGRRLVTAQRQPTVLLNLGIDEGAVAQTTTPLLPLTIFVGRGSMSEIAMEDLGREPLIRRSPDLAQRASSFC
jgi:hypothetical protein